MRRYWAATLTMEESDAEAAWLQKHIEEHGFSAAEVPGLARFIGFIGLKYVEPDLPFAPAVEAGWRLARNYWGRGYATEGAQASLVDGFGKLGLKEIFASTVAVNARSRRVMERIGMTYEPADDFDDKDRKPTILTAAMSSIAREGTNDSSRPQLRPVAFEPRQDVGRARATRQQSCGSHFRSFQCEALGAGPRRLPLLADAGGRSPRWVPGGGPRRCHRGFFYSSRAR